MKKGTKFTLAGIVAVTGLLAIAGCTKSFCSNVDTGRMLYAFDNGVTLYEVGSETETITSATGLTYVVKNLNKTYATWDEENQEFKFDDENKLTYLNEINKAAGDAGVLKVNQTQLPYFVGKGMMI